jgi:hypothetical protein
MFFLIFFVSNPYSFLTIYQRTFYRNKPTFYRVFGRSGKTY